MLYYTILCYAMLYYTTILYYIITLHSGGQRRRGSPSVLQYPSASGSPTFAERRCASSNINIIFK